MINKTHDGAGTAKGESGFLPDLGLHSLSTGCEGEETVTVQP